jgi:hypothetical protein
MSITTESSAVEFPTEKGDKLQFISAMTIEFTKVAYEPCPLTSQDSIWHLGVVAVVPEVSSTITSATLLRI